MAYKKGSEPKRVKRRRVVKAKPTFAKKVIQVVNSQVETKYVAQDLVLSTQVPSGQTTPAQFKQMLPTVTQGTGDSQRIGDTIKPIKARTMITVNFNQSSINFDDVQVNVLVLMAKGASTQGAVGGLPPGQLLRVGNGINTDPDATVYTQLQFLQHINKYQINSEQYTLCKWFKRRFAKGSYNINGVPGANATSQVAVAQPAHTFVYDWKPPVLRYSTPGAVLPTNHYPVYLVWCTTSDGGSYSGALEFGTRTELYFKDA